MTVWTFICELCGHNDSAKQGGLMSDWKLNYKTFYGDGKFVVIDSGKEKIPQLEQFIFETFPYHFKNILSSYGL